jgi:hypothetical protein
MTFSRTFSIKKFNRITNRRMTFIFITFSRIALGRMTFSTLTFSVMIFCRKKFNRLILRKRTKNRLKVNGMTLNIKTLCKKTLNIVPFTGITFINDIQYNRFKTCIFQTGKIWCMYINGFFYCLM